MGILFGIMLLIYCYIANFSKIYCAKQHPFVISHGYDGSAVVERLKWAVFAVVSPVVAGRCQLGLKSSEVMNHDCWVMAVGCWLLAVGWGTQFFPHGPLHEAVWVSL